MTKLTQAFTIHFTHLSTYVNCVEFFLNKHKNSFCLYGKFLFVVLLNWPAKLSNLIEEYKIFSNISYIIITYNTKSKYSNIIQNKSYVHTVYPSYA